MFRCTECQKEVEIEFVKCSRCFAFGSCSDLDEIIDSEVEVEESDKPVKLSEVEIEEQFYHKTLSYVDDLLSGGFVPDNVYLLSGEPGAGKSTLVLQLAEYFKKTLYITAEETLEAIKRRSNRLKIKGKGITVWSENNIVEAFSHAQDFDLVIVDSIQRFFHPEVGGNPGTVSQMTHSTAHLVAATKGCGCITIAIAQINGEGNVAGPKSVEHLADATLHLEVDEDGIRPLRIFKNRHGKAPHHVYLRLAARGFENAKR